MSSRAVALVAGTAVAVSASAARSQEVGSFTPVPGVRELSGQMLIRPIQESTWAERGAADALQRTAAAKSILAARTIRVLPVTDIHVVGLQPGETEQAVSEELMATGFFEFAEPDWIVYPLSGPDTRPDDPSLRAQWHIDKIQAPKAWNGFTGDGSIVCAFVDTGIDLTHPDLAPLLIPGFNSVNNLAQASGGMVSDINGHGTAVAGAALAMGNNNSGGSGVCWSARIMPIRATNLASGSAFMSNVLYGASWAAFNGARVVSVSYAGIESSSVEPTGLAIKNNYGGLLVWAAGNSSTNLTFDYAATTVVGSTDVNDNLAWDTNYGPAIDVMAPGVQVFVPALGGGYAYRNGSSFAGPIAAGVLALAWSSAPALTPDQAMNAFYRSASRLEPVHPQNATGWGRVNALTAVQLAHGIIPPKVPQLLTASGIPQVLAGGLQASYYAVPPAATSLPTHLGGTPIGTATVSTVNFPSGPLPGCPIASGFAVALRGYIEVPSTGVYTFTLLSRDGSRLLIDGRKIVNNDGIHASRFRSGTVWLERGMHHVECDYFSSTSQPSLVLSVRGERLGEVIVPASMLKREPGALTPITQQWP